MCTRGDLARHEIEFLTEEEEEEEEEFLIPPN
jgi:hypothetical protein